MPLQRRKVESQLRHKFKFVDSEQHGHDHVWLELKLPGIPVVLTKLSHSKDDLRNPLIKRMASQLRVDSQFFIGMINCSKSDAEFRQRCGVAQ